MANQTPNKGLTLPISTERYSVDVFNKNNQIIDAELHNLDEKNTEQDNKLSSVQEDLSGHKNNNNNPHKVTASQIGLGKVENKSSEDIRNEITSDNVTGALGYTPYTPAEIDNKFSTLEEDKKKLDDLYLGLDELKKSVANGKELLATAISEKGIDTASTDSFETMSNNIRKIITPNANTVFTSKFLNTGCQIKLPILSNTTKVNVTFTAPNNKNYIDYQISGNSFPLKSGSEPGTSFSTGEIDVTGNTVISIFYNLASSNEFNASEVQVVTS